ncbi:MAG: elongation factor G [Actinobacteria bacterium]|nr:elongation factor G [Actinomycetota bacterium]
MPAATTATERIRNVLLVGHGGTGKTTLAEALISLGGRESSRGSLLDSEPEERERGNSLSLGVGWVRWRDHHINVLDAPGGDDAIGDAYPALASADVALFVVDAAAGVQPQHDRLWAACDQLELPRIVVLNQLDKSQANYQATIDALRERCGNALAPVHMPIGVGAGFTGVIDLLNFVAVEKTPQGRAEHDVPDERRDQADRNRQFLVEAIVEQDDDLLMAYLEGETPAAAELGKVFAEGIASGGFFPVLCASAAAGIGVKLLADFVISEGPAPQATGDQTAALVVKTLSDPYVGRINILRLLGGTLHADDVLRVQRTGDKVRLHQLFRLQGGNTEPVTQAPAGDIVAVAKLEDVRTNDLLDVDGSTAMPAVAPPPEPYFRVAVVPATAGDEDKLSSALSRIAEEDPALRLVRDAETNQLVAAVYGPTHMTVVQSRLQRKFGVSVDTASVRIAYRETVRSTAEGIGKHVKQSGGHGQYGIAQVRVAPAERGVGFTFHDKIVGGVIPRQFISSVERGIVDAMAAGVLAGYPVVDVEVTLFDGKHHSVDSSDFAFQMAGSLAFRNAATNAGIVLLEPIDEVRVDVPDALTGDVMGDLSSRRGRIQGSGRAGPNTALVVAHVPRAELVRYAADLRSLTSGAGGLQISPSHYEQVPDHIAERIIAEASDAA